MDSSLYKDLTVARGLNYHYYYAPPQGGRPILLLLHGFPNTSWAWKEQVPFFKNEGYGLIVPDMLGYGGTSAPTDPGAYLASLIVKDIVDILDAEKVDKAIAVGHDWGARITGRLANYFPDRITAHAFLAVGYQPPSTENNYDKFLQISKQMFGYELFGYWRFLSSPDAPTIIESHIDSFLSVLYSSNPENMATHFAPLGALQSWLLADKTAEPADYLISAEREHHKQELLKTGLVGPTAWYKILTSELDADDNKAAPPQNFIIDKPTLYLGCAKDKVALAGLQKGIMEKFCTNMTYKELDAGHWLVWEAKDEVNEELLTWLKAL